MLRKRLLSYGLSFVVLGSLGAACASKTERGDFGSDGNTADGGSSGIGIGESDGGSSGIGGRTDLTEFSGTTYAPNGDLELAGVLVYWQLTEPAEIPEGVYCDTCVELPGGTSTISNADGTFKLKVPTGEEVYLVVQKGQFRRVRKLTFSPDDNEFDKEVTTLPGKMRKSVGDTIPKIALFREPRVGSDFDPIQVALEGLGIEEWDNLDGNTTKLKSDINKYNLVMFPCGSGSPSAEQKDAIRPFVAAGGKIYASDYSMSFADKTFPEFFPSATQTHDSESSPRGAFEDDGMKAWLEAIGDNPDNVTFEGVWSEFNGLQPASVPTPANDGTMETFTPKVWAKVSNSSNYGTGEASVSFPYGCGRGMASIFHVHGGDSSNLLQQEKALLFMLLEVSACVPPGGDVH